jgi:hypothetical protein
MKPKILQISIAILLLIWVNSVKAQVFDALPPPPMEENSWNGKKLTTTELKLEVSEKAANLVKSPINGVEVN